MDRVNSCEIQIDSSSPYSYPFPVAGVLLGYFKKHTPYGVLAVSEVFFASKMGGAYLKMHHIRLAV